MEIHIYNSNAFPTMHKKCITETPTDMMLKKFPKP